MFIYALRLSLYHSDIKPRIYKMLFCVQSFFINRLLDLLLVTGVSVFLKESDWKSNQRSATVPNLYDLFSTPTFYQLRYYLFIVSLKMLIM